MVVTQIGDDMASAQKLVVVGSRREQEHVPIHGLQMAEKTAVHWDPTVLPENATINNAKVSEINAICITRYCALLEQNKACYY